VLINKGKQLMKDDDLIKQTFAKLSEAGARAVAKGRTVIITTVGKAVHFSPKGNRVIFTQACSRPNSYKEV
jgi:hypothetical protein